MASRTKFCTMSCLAQRRNAAPISKPQIRLGLLSDIQYANIDDNISSSGTKRFYRNTLNSLEQAISNWTLQEVNCVVNLGDIIDAYNMVTDTSEQALEAVLEVFEKLPEGTEVRHVLGNHCVCQPVERECLLDKLGMKMRCSTLPESPESGYYSFVPHDCWRMIVLDGCDVSTYAWNETHPNYKQAAEILTSNSDVKILPDNEKLRKFLKASRKDDSISEKDFTDSLKGLDKRFVFYNGAVSQKQLQWFADELEDAKLNQQNVMVFCHMPLLPGICRPGMLLWNYDEVLETIHDYTETVRGVFCGHVHHWGFQRDQYGIPHMVLPAVLETAPGEEAHGMVEAYEDKIIISGFSKGDMTWEFGKRKGRSIRLTTEGTRTPVGV
eukprot:g4521.t1